MVLNYFEHTSEWVEERERQKDIGQQSSDYEIKIALINEHKNILEFIKMCEELLVSFQYD